MIRSAAGEPLAFTQDDLTIQGWAVESRIYAEGPLTGSFLPSIGRLVRYDPPKEGERGAYTVRNDAGVREGDEISMFYDPMISKLCTWGATRAEAVAGMGPGAGGFPHRRPGPQRAVPGGGDGSGSFQVRPAVHRLHQGRISRRLRWNRADAVSG